MELAVPALRIFWLISHGRWAPVVALTAPIELAGWPLIVLNRPPTTTPVESGVSTSESTWASSAVGAHDFRLPLLRSNEASRRRVCPLALKKLPPAYTVSLVASTPRTVEAIEGSKEFSSAPVAVLKAAR